MYKSWLIFIPERPSSFRRTRSSWRRTPLSHFCSCSSVCFSSLGCRSLDSFVILSVQSIKLGSTHRNFELAFLFKLITSLGTGIKQLSHTRLSSSLLERTHFPRASSPTASLRIRLTLNPTHLGIHFALSGKFAILLLKRNANHFYIHLKLSISQ